MSDARWQGQHPRIQERVAPPPASPSLGATECLTTYRQYQWLDDETAT